MVQYSQAKYLKLSKEKKHPAFPLTFRVHTLLSLPRCHSLGESIKGSQSRSPRPRLLSPLCQVRTPECILISLRLLSLHVSGGPLCQGSDLGRGQRKFDFECWFMRLSTHSVLSYTEARDGITAL